MTATAQRARIDVSHLPHDVLDHRSPIWWGNLLLLLIETTMFALVIAAYFYFRIVDFDHWPPPQVDRVPVMFHPVPRLIYGTINLGIILLSLAPMFWVDRACLQRNVSAVKTGLFLSVILGLAAVTLRFLEFHGLYFRWDANAYSSIVWTTLGLHLAHLITGTCENGLMLAWICIHGMDDKHARDIRVTGVYWYWIVGFWLLLYLMIYWVPRWS
jgi:heme/copper-type cytochrome/quinol oxidase subunit 3